MRGLESTQDLMFRKTETATASSSDNYLVLPLEQTLAMQTGSKLSVKQNLGLCSHV